MAEQEAQFADDAARYGIPLELLQDATDIVPDEFEIWPENDVLLGIFLRCTTQFRHRPVGQGSIITGLDYAAVETVLRLHRIKNKAEIFDDVRAMEMAILQKINESEA